MYEGSNNMRKLWECKDWSSFIKQGCRTGIRLRFDKEVDPEVKRACKEFVSWLRTQYEFPVRVPIYFKAAKSIISIDGEIGVASFFGPNDKSQEPYIRIAVGDYQEMLVERGKDDALAANLGAIAQELSHYYQWIKGYDFDNAKCRRQAQYYAGEILCDYAETREHP